MAKRAFAPQYRQYNPSGSVVAPRVMLVCGEAVARQSVPALIVYVRCCSKWLREFRRFCDHVGIGIVTDPDGNSPHGPDAFEVVGPLELLKRLTEHPCVRDWHPIINRSVSTRATGAMPAK